MPYIKPQDRTHVYKNGPNTAGELNYAITCMVLTYLERNKVCYQTYNDIMGAMEGAKLELYRRMIGPYEDTKIKENGDIYV